MGHFSPLGQGKCTEYVYNSKVNKSHQIDPNFYAINSLHTQSICLQVVICHTLRKKCAIPLHGYTSTGYEGKSSHFTPTEIWSLVSFKSSCGTAATKHLVSPIKLKSSSDGSNPSHSRGLKEFAEMGDEHPGVTCSAQATTHTIMTNEAEARQIRAGWDVSVDTGVRIKPYAVEANW